MNVLRTKLWPLGLTLLGLLVIIATHRDYGISWDEPVQSHYAEGVWRYFHSGGVDSSVNDLHHMRFYGPLFDLAAASLYSGSPEAKYDIRHFAIAVTGLLTVLGVLRLASHVPGRWSPLYACLALIMMPRFYGHAFINSKDIPFACCFVWTIVSLFELARNPRRWQRVLLAGLALGSTLGVRPGGVPLLFLLYACLMALGTWSRGETGARELARLALASVATWVIAWGVMVSLWPWAHESPVANPIAAIRAALSFPDTFPVLFDGRVSMSDDLPRHYMAKFIAITTPLPTLLLAAIGVVASVRWQRRDMSSSQALFASTLQLWLFVPLAVIAIGRPNVYDGIRHVLFTLPALALFAAWGAVALIEALPVPVRRSVAPVVLGLALALPTFALIRLHPYQMTYFNRLVGGLEGAYGRYETDYWLLSYREAMEWVNDRAREHGKREIRVLVAVDDYAYECAARFAGPGVEMEQMPEMPPERLLPAGFDYSIAITRFGLEGNYPDSPIVHRVGRDGGVFSVVRGR